MAGVLRAFGLWRTEAEMDAAAPANPDLHALLRAGMQRPEWVHTARVAAGSRTFLLLGESHEHDPEFDEVMHDVEDLCDTSNKMDVMLETPYRWRREFRRRESSTPHFDHSEHLGRLENLAVNRAQQCAAVRYHAFDVRNGGIEHILMHSFRGDRTGIAVLQGLPRGGVELLDGAVTGLQQTWDITQKLVQHQLRHASPHNRAVVEEFVRGRDDVMDGLRDVSMWDAAQAPDTFVDMAQHLASDISARNADAYLLARAAREDMRDLVVVVGGANHTRAVEPFLERMKF